MPKYITKSSPISQPAKGAVRVPQILKPSASKEDSENQISQSVLTLLQKRKKTSRVRRFECPYHMCKKSYARKKRLVIHCIRIHSKAVPQQDAKEESKEVQIEGACNTISDWLECHEQKQQQEPRMDIEVHADMKTKIQRSLNELGEMKLNASRCLIRVDELLGFKCPICERLFTERYNLLVHQRTHTGHRPFKCPQCDQSFSIQGNLKDHVRRHYTIKPYCCETCNKSYYRKYLLINHQKRCIGKSSHEQISHSEQSLVQSPSIDQTRHKSSNNGLAINLANDDIPEGITVIKLPPRSIQTQIAHHKSIADIKIATQSEEDQNEIIERERGVSLSFQRIQSSFNQPSLDQCRNAFSQNGSLKIGEHVPLSQNNHDSLTQFRINEKQILQQCESQATLNMQSTSPLIKNNEFCKESLGQRIYLDDLSTHSLETAQFQCQIASKRSLQSNGSQLFVKPAQRTESIRSLAEQLESLQGQTPTQQFQTAYIPKMLVQAQASLRQQTNFQQPLASAGNGSLQNQSQLHQSTGTALTTNQMILYPLASSCMEDGISHNSSTNVNSLIIQKSVPQNFSEKLVLQKPYENQHPIENNQVSGVLYSRFMVPSNATELNRQGGQNQLNHFDRPQEPSFSQACHQNQNIGSPIYIINIPQPQAVSYYQNIQTGILANGANFQQNNKGQFMISYEPNLKSNLALLHPLIPSTLQNQIYF